MWLRKISLLLAWWLKKVLLKLYDYEVRKGIVTLKVKYLQTKGSILLPQFKTSRIGSYGDIISEQKGRSAANRSCECNRLLTLKKYAKGPLKYIVVINWIHICKSLKVLVGVCEMSHFFKYDRFSSCLLPYCPSLESRFSKGDYSKCSCLYFLIFII